MVQQPAMNCPHCGGTLALDDLTRPNCPFCGQVLPHHARAAEHAVLVNQVLQNQFAARYPGLPPGQVPQIGYQMGAGVNGLEAFQQGQIQQGMKRAWGMSVVILLVTVGIILLAFFGAGVAMYLMF